MKAVATVRSTDMQRDASQFRIVASVCVWVTATFGLAIATGASIDATRLSISAPISLVELDGRKLNGDPYWLTWSPDATQLCVHIAPPDRRQAFRPRYFVFDLATRQLTQVEKEPAWAPAYWAWKSAQAAPFNPDFKIIVEVMHHLTMPPAVGTDPNVHMTPGVEEPMTMTLTLRGEIVGESDSPIAPGLTFGWAPEKLGVISFVNRDGRLVIMDQEGRKQELSASKNAFLPAWSEDGKSLAFLERSGRKNFILMLVAVGSASAVS